MRILHVSDLHLGRQFAGLSLDEDHQVVLDQILEALIEHQPRALVIAGDIFDRASPPASAVRLFNGFLRRVTAETSAAIVMIAGNHDSADRISAMSILTDTQRALVGGALAPSDRPFTIADEHGEVAFSALPYSPELNAREFFGDQAISTPNDVLRAQLAQARKIVPAGARWVVAAHGFVAGGTLSDTERSLTRVGGIETISAEVFAGAHYVALGHLHRAQHVEHLHIRYSGAPLAFSFAEADQPKSMQLVAIDGQGSVSVTPLPFAPRRRVRIVQGLLAELERSEPSQDFVMAVLTDETPPIDPMKRLRQAFPNACQIAYAGNEKKRSGAVNVESASTSPAEVIDAFVIHVRGEGLQEGERALVVEALTALQHEGDEE
jgi:exonuclease SbcD